MTTDSNDRSEVSLDDVGNQPEQDAIAALHDTEAEAGDEEELDDVFELDKKEARELGVNLDSVAPEEPRLD
ncbi:MAG: hypothetical protein QOG53_2135 [Frankiales bacterium]|jgi:hypothetical protein|nr:hypothetical protein [Frankiales bacterium]